MYDKHSNGPMHGIRINIAIHKNIFLSLHFIILIIANIDSTILRITAMKNSAN